jgi:hypothetical protein
MLRFDPPHDSTTTSFYTPTKKRRGDFTVHFDEVLSIDEQNEIIKALSCRKGVEKIEFQPHHPHLAIVYYDVFLTSSKTIFEMLNSDCLFPFQVNDGDKPRIHVQIVGL